MRGLALMLSVVSLFTGVTGGLFPDASDPTSITVLVNRQHTLHHTYEPEQLVLPAVQPAPRKEKAIYMRPEAAGALEALFSAAAAAGHTLYAVSGYRSYATQKSLFGNKVEAVGEKRAMLTVAPPGASEHQLGLAMDINGATTVDLGLVEAFGASPEGIWVGENAHRYGFIIRYPQDKTDITGYAWEPWHLRYLGAEVAAEVYELGVTYEEYQEVLQRRRLEAWVLTGGED